jgi:3-deoxy-D-manno-octulosonic-acid transferase
MVFYRLFFGLGLVAYAPYAFLRQAAGGKRIGDWRGRIGLSSLPKFEESIWIHGVSVGEVNAARTILEAIREESPGIPRILSSSTAAGLEMAGRVAAADASIPFPFDLARPVERALAAIDPSLVLLTETEIWPLFLERCARRRVPVAIVNGRISSTSFDRYRRTLAWLAPSLSRIALFAMQTEEDAERVRALGVPAERVRVTGNVKFDVAACSDREIAQRLRRWADGRRIVIAGSTHETEEAAVVDAWETLEPRPLLVIAPRRPERFEEVFRAIENRGLRAARSSSDASAPDVVVLDTVGELASAFAAADLAFIGGTLVPVGGHNPIEAWAHGVPTILGPHVTNMRAIAEAGIAEGAAIPVRSREELASAVRAILSDDSMRRSRSEAAMALVARHRGAARTTARAALALRIPA